MALILFLKTIGSLLVVALAEEGCPEKENKKYINQNPLVWGF